LLCGGSCVEFIVLLFVPALSYDLVVLVFNFYTNINDTDVCYNLFANVENILYSHTMIVLLVCYKDKNNKGTYIYMQMAQIYEQFQLRLLLCVII
jgi:hypothetical protein